MSRVKVAVIGSGPSGFYAVSALLKQFGDPIVDIIERLPTPFGLIRAGVAPDHQTTKNVVRAFSKTAAEAGVSYFGNVSVGKDVSLAELRELYDAVILAVGAPADRKLEIPGIDKAGVYGSAKFVGWYNGHPDFVALDPDLNTERVVVIGNGNVAIDVARVLVKSPEEMAASDLPGPVADVIHRSPIKDVVVVGRRGPGDAKFTNVELREMRDLDHAVSIVRHEYLPDELPTEVEGRDRRVREKNLQTMEAFAEPGDDLVAGAEKRVHFEFYASPVEVLGDKRVEGVRFERTEVTEGGNVRGTGAYFTIHCGLVVTAVGYRTRSFEGVDFDAKSGSILNKDGQVADNLYAVGWAKRGPSGVIGSSKRDGDEVARMIAETFAREGDANKPGHEGLKRLLQARKVAYVDFGDWQKLDAAEIARADSSEAPREKFLSVEEMLAAIGPKSG